MKLLREVSTRGTEDCPLAYYHQIGKINGQVMANMHWHPEFEIIYVHDGNITIQIENQDLIINKESVVFVNPNMLHKITVCGNYCDYTAFVFSLNLLTLLPTHFFMRDFINPIKQGKLTFPTKITKYDNEYSAITASLNEIIITDKADKRYKYIVFNSIFNLFLKMSAHCFTTTQKNDIDIKRNEIMKTCINFLENNFDSQVSLKSVADQVHLHPNYLCRLFKEYTGQTIFQYLSEIRIEEACRLLLTTSMPVSQIATECGFESISFFAKKFKELTNTTPKAYAKNKNN